MSVDQPMPVMLPVGSGNASEGHAVLHTWIGEQHCTGRLRCVLMTSASDGLTTS